MIFTDDGGTIHYGDMHPPANGARTMPAGSGHCGAGDRGAGDRDPDDRDSYGRGADGRDAAERMRGKPKQ